METNEESSRDWRSLRILVRIGTGNDASPFSWSLGSTTAGAGGAVFFSGLVIMLVIASGSRGKLTLQEEGQGG